MLKYDNELIKIAYDIFKNNLNVHEIPDFKILIDDQNKIWDSDYMLADENSLTPYSRINNDKFIDNINEKTGILEF